MSEDIKYIAKLAVLHVRLLLLGITCSQPNQVDWQDRILLINLGAIGDLIVFTSVLKHYRRAFPGKKIFLLISSANGIDPALVEQYVDTVIFIDHKKFNRGAWYGYAMVKKLQAIGFATVIEHNPHLEFAGKVIAIELGAKKVIGYEGVRIDIEKPLLKNYTRGFFYIKKKIFPRYTDVIPNTVDKQKRANNAEYLPNIIHHHIAIFEFASHAPQKDYSTELVTEHYGLSAPIKKALEDQGIADNTYCMLSLTAGSPSKEWEWGKFAKLCDYLAEKKIPVVIVGTKNDRKRTADFQNLITYPVLNLSGVTKLLDAVVLAKHALFTLSNETSIGHIAIALKKPSLVIAGAWNLGMWTFYGYKDINRWVYKKNAPCAGDNGKCTIANPDKAAPCLTAISPEEAKIELGKLLDDIATSASHPQKAFAMDFGT